jgi:FMN phosphatase YigB (HAD superfamily)
MRAVLFDLDGTLLDLDLGAFLDRYFAALEAAAGPLAPHMRADADAMSAIHAAVRAMMLPHAGETNENVFYQQFHALTGADLSVHWPVFGEFYANVFPTLGDTAAPAAGARRAVSTALDLGLKVAIATNPIFPREAVACRLAWAELADLPVHLVTTYETMEACKPDAVYYLQTAQLLGVAPGECLMVGDDRSLDMPAADVGMRTYYVGDDVDAPADMRGDLEALADLLPRLV